MDKTAFNIEEELKKLPTEPGVYIMHDENDIIIYVGKAVILKNRVRSYFRESTNKTAKIRQMVDHISWFEYVVTGSELEALVLENNLIKEHQPKYNTLLKDDKTYPYIKVSVNEDFPRIYLTRQVKKDGARYFGPFTSAAAVKDTIELLQKLYGIRPCGKKIKAGEDDKSEVMTDAGYPSDTDPKGTCLYYHLGRCKAPCVRAVSKEEYAGMVKKALDFLNGNYRPVINDLKEKMQMASEELDYEKAIEYRDLIDSVTQVTQKQRITDAGSDDRDIIAMARDAGSVIIQVFYIRGGKIIGREHHYMENAYDASDADLIRNFILQFYSGTPYIPGELLIPVNIEDSEVMEEWLTKKRGNRVHILIPQKGKKEKLIELAERNAQIVLRQDLEKVKNEEKRTKGAVKEISDLLGLYDICRMEAYDISNISGYDSVGSMVVYENGKPKKNDYRKFKIKTVEGPDDYASLYEVLDRRFKHGLTESEEEKDRGADASGRFSRFPDLIMMDGGKGQVNMALEVLRNLGLDIPVCGMVKDDNHRTRGLYYNNTELPIDKNSEGFKLITRIQDEAHRFAIEYHRHLRKGSQVHSVLDDIKGIGVKRRKALMHYFESIEDIKKADVEELKKVPSMDTASAEAVYGFFHGAVL
ncbi:MAG: excinuclease ABC subunit UvrC [Lachnospiraceae bacterium]|nr:excinuclease ABC subunit UvrC [Lachnospiraceae bacterium]